MTSSGVYRDYCVSLSRHGFRKKFMLPSHGGNFKPLDNILDELDKEVIQKAIDEGFHTVTHNGILGDVREMSKEIGEKCLSALTDVVADYFRHA